MNRVSNIKKNNTNANKINERMTVGEEGYTNYRPLCSYCHWSRARGHCLLRCRIELMEVP